MTAVELRRCRSLSTTPRRWIKGYGRVAVVVVATIAYVLLLQLEVMRFRPATAAFLMFTMACLTNCSHRQFPLVFGVSVATAWGLHAVLARLFEVVLP